MTLDEFIKEQKYRLIKFEKHYKFKAMEEEVVNRNLDENNICWPLEMASGDWDEQLTI